MLRKLTLLFQTLTFIGVVAITLTFFNIGRDFLYPYFHFFLVSTWIGLIGDTVVNRYRKKQENSG
ncbi:hypothetical protein [Metabacillus malikii]|uniref:DUF4305 domain-containing protein n=1 Tax=Metabacillus malikii TaxID=1504265 RepID=A0ABT9ZLT5_9BACI|nr:hypothetical protein [Metabacillus malikii]MDQ0233262.1 hypothetical protein [Metabacillus malikii]